MTINCSERKRYFGKIFLYCTIKRAISEREEAPMPSAQHLVQRAPRRPWGHADEHEMARVPVIASISFWAMWELPRGWNNTLSPGSVCLFGVGLQHANVPAVCPSLLFFCLLQAVIGYLWCTGTVLSAGGSSVSPFQQLSFTLHATVIGQRCFF